MLLEQPDDRHHEAGRAEAALKAVALVEGLLHGVKRGAWRGQAFDSRDVVAFGLDREHQAGTHRRSVEQDRAAAANAVLAPDVRPGQPEVVAQVVRQQPARV